ncbi:MAG TPA: helix-turn-helix domain-containing protein [Pyrinomonadaceae bacterium]
MEALIGEMLDGRILLDEAISEFEKIYIKKALERNCDHLSKTAAALGIHRNTLSKRVAGYNGKPKVKPPVKKKPAKKKKTTTSTSRARSRSK